MSDSIDPRLLDYYQRELTWLRHAGADFAERYPKIAHRLELSGYESPDPHVERLLEGFAFLSARLQRQLDDGYSQLSDALLEQLYPYAVRPMPSVGIAQFLPDATKGNVAEGYTVARDTPLFVNTPQGDTIHFRTTAPVTVWPLTVGDALLLPADEAQALTGLRDVRSALRLRIDCLAPHQWHALPLDSLRIQLTGSPTTSAALYDLLCAHSLAMFVALPGESPRRMGQSLPHAAGFTETEALLPLEDGVLPAYRLLLEYFACPAKFAMFDLPVQVPTAATGQIELIIAFDNAPSSRISLQPSDLALGCAPVVNLFPRTSEPLRPDATRREYRVVADSHRERSVEIYAIRKVRVSSADNAMQVPAYFAFSHAQKDNGVWWHARRVQGVGSARHGSDMMLTWVDAGFDPTLPQSQSLTADLLCTNRHLAETLAPGTRLSFEQPGPVAQVNLVNRPSPQLDADLDGSSQWRLVSHLSLNHLSLVEDAQPLAALREMLALYNLSDTQANRRQISGLTHLETVRAVAHVGRQAWRGWRNGLEVRVTLDAEHFAGASRVLFSGVLAHFLSQYASVNRFVRTVLVEQDREIKTWQPLVGDPLIL
ncbi:type VI secretion system protein ImpG [Silvimonas terrae]|uniref:Type VI secretion system protein ImpG n=1 Tax=Silvimonas terrae TaxID=300266 RepID=A0A840REC1_9NEIS|nr:type VI secretion system baseplate subunit TssF [Silvimonas terrae]MBB5190652.1 type VI secretion system protein ImpG [Silvimonas terrae]